ncbi:MAG TPA: hypothetical protein VMG10_36975 [Gemmataceae bacterium]|nr:hypothetical protein [Gemmataceae bacterium]
MPEVVCSHCHKKIHPPDRLAGRRVTCPRCSAVLMVPLLPDSSEEIATDSPAAEIEVQDPPIPSSARMGIVALVLGCVSVLIMCLPVIGYGSIVLSGIGLPVGLWGLFRARMEGDGMLCRSLTGGTGLAGNFGARPRDYALAGVVACLLALTLALLPLLMRGSPNR